MNNQPAYFVFKLRQNIALEGDLQIAQMELDAFLPGTLKIVERIETLLRDFPALGQLRGFGNLNKHTRQNGNQAFLAQGTLEMLPNLIRRVSFVERIYCITENTEDAQVLVSKLEKDAGPVIVAQVNGGQLIVQAVPYYALFELADVVARHTHGTFETKQRLDDLVCALLDKTEDHDAVKMTEVALSARSVIAPLSHDVHYYKAKFFPRLARSMLNVCMQKLGERPHRVVDNFAGSGTTLLEASTLGVPSVGFDIDPLSVLIAKAKLEAVQFDSDFLAGEVARMMDNSPTRKNGQLRLFDTKLAASYGVAEMTFPAWFMKNRKVTTEIANQLKDEISTIQMAIAKCDPKVSTLFRVLMSDAISRKIRMRFLGTGVGRFSFTLAQTPLARIFSKSLEDYVKVAAISEWCRKTLNLKFASADVVAADTRHIPDGLGPFDILLTSPPYLPASSGRESYAKARAPSLIALGIKTHDNVDNLADDSIGSMDGNGVDIASLTSEERRVVEWLQHDESRSIKAEPTARYFLDMRQTYREMLRILSPGALAVVVSGKQSIFYQFSTREVLLTVPCAELLAEEACGVGFEVVGLHDVQLNKANMNARPRSLDSYFETLIFLRKPGVPR
jgi:predicted RNA methylase